ncbi:MAG: PQQ-like beta-propeller repeat protein [Bacteroidales bacterium]|nr:PQQ-like beta-propeller repeat protein [Bacteroidales bacterium]
MKSILIMAILAFSQLSFAQIVTTWRGPGMTGVYNETGVLKEWPASGPEIVWSLEEFGEGHSSPVFTNGKIYLTGMLDKMGYIFIISKDGKLEKKVAYGTEFFENYPGTRSTPNIIDNLAYVLSGKGKLYCINLDTEKEVWKKDLFTDFDGTNLKWGVTESVIVNGEMIYVTPGGAKHNVVALNRKTGDLIWSCKGKGELSAYCTPLIVELPKRKLLVTHSASHVMGIDAGSGMMLWSYEHPNKWSVHANTPVYDNGMLLCASGYGYGAVMLKLSDDGSSVSKVWFSKDLDNRMGGLVKLGDYVYGSGDKKRSWKCLDWNTGAIQYDSTTIAKGVVIAADNMLYCYSERGQLALVEATPKQFKPSGLTKVTLGTAQHWAHPVINEGRLYVRHGNALIAYKIK